MGIRGLAIAILLAVQGLLYLPLAVGAAGVKCRPCSHCISAQSHASPTAALSLLDVSAPPLGGAPETCSLHCGSAAQMLTPGSSEASKPSADRLAVTLGPGVSGPSQVAHAHAYVRAGPRALSHRSTLAITSVLRL